MNLKRSLAAVVVTLLATLTGDAHTVSKAVTEELNQATLERLRTSNVDNLEATARDRMATLQALIEQGQKKKIETLKERMTLRTAEVFLKFAAWDEANQEEITGYFKIVPLYKQIASEVAGMLPNFERHEVVRMLDEAIAQLTSLNAGEISRAPIQSIDWAQVTHEGDQLTFEGRPVFLADYTWKPETPELQEFHGQQDGFFLMHPYVLNENGEINHRIARELEEKPDGRTGFIFLNHKNSPEWANDKYGPDFAMREDTYTAYDIDNPGAREINRLLLAGTVPGMAGKKYTELGYMLCNEPHFFTTEGVWATGPVSEYTKAKFRIWLSHKHASIADLNSLWGSDFKSFEDVTIDIPISKELQGTPKWYDWVTFNMDRVTEWYAFLKSEIRKYDPKAKVHLKIMPNLWTDNSRNHGIDMEALTRLSEIIGNDAGADYNHMWGPSREWESRYAFDWRELCMGYDFYKSVSPEKIMYNTEAHFLSTGTSRDLFMEPMYARATYWLAHTHGLNASQTWFWPRLEDGSLRKGAGKGFGGSNCQQPRIVNEVASTMMDLNSFAEEITAMQRQRKPLRIFYSETSATNKADHMDDVFHLYESLCFEGVPIGFATKDIIKEQDNQQWDAILVHKTEYATPAEVAALQAYLDGGGTVLIDGPSLKQDEYGRPLETLRASKGTLIEQDSLDGMKAQALEVAARKGSLPDLQVTEVNGADAPGCIWKCVKNRAGNHVLSVVNVGKTDATLSINLKGSTGVVCRNLIDGIQRDSNPTLKPYQVLFVEIAPGRN